jgi:hypothetical protein
MASTDQSELEQLRKELAAKERQVEIAQLRKQLAIKDAQLNEMANSGPAEASQTHEALDLRRLFVIVATSGDEDARIDALEQISDAVNSASNEDGAVIGAVVRQCGGVQLLGALVVGQSLPLQQEALVLLGNLCSTAVDPLSSETKTLLYNSGAAGGLVACLDSPEPAIVMCACGALQNLCHDVWWARACDDLGARERLQKLSRDPDPTIARYSAGALKNMSVRLQSDAHRLQAFTRKRALRVISKHAKVIAPEARLRRYLSATGDAMAAQAQAKAVHDFQRLARLRRAAAENGEAAQGAPFEEAGAAAEAAAMQAVAATEAAATEAAATEAAATEAAATEAAATEAAATETVATEAASAAAAMEAAAAEGGMVAEAAGVEAAMKAETAAAEAAAAETAAGALEAKVDEEAGAAEAKAGAAGAETAAAADLTMASVAAAEAAETTAAQAAAIKAEDVQAAVTVPEMGLAAAKGKDSAAMVLAEAMAPHSAEAEAALVVMAAADRDAAEEAATTSKVEAEEIVPPSAAQDAGRVEDVAAHPVTAETTSADADKAEAASDATLVAPAQTDDVVFEAFEPPVALNEALVIEGERVTPAGDALAERALMERASDSGSEVPAETEPAEPNMTKVAGAAGIGGVAELVGKEAVAEAASGGEMAGAAGIEAMGIEEAAEGAVNSDRSVTLAADEEVAALEGDGGNAASSGEAVGLGEVSTGHGTAAAEAASDSSVSTRLDPVPHPAANEMEGAVHGGTAAKVEAGPALTADASVKAVGRPEATMRGATERPNSTASQAAGVRGSVYGRVVGEGEAAAATTINSHVRRLQGRERAQEVREEKLEACMRERSEAPHPAVSHSSRADTVAITNTGSNLSLPVPVASAQGAGKRVNPSVTLTLWDSAAMAEAAARATALAATLAGVEEEQTETPSAHPSETQMPRRDGRRKPRRPTNPQGQTPPSRAGRAKETLKLEGESSARAPTGRAWASPVTSARTAVPPPGPPLGPPPGPRPRTQASTVLFHESSNRAGDVYVPDLRASLEWTAYATKRARADTARERFPPRPDGSSPPTHHEEGHALPPLIPLHLLESMGLSPHGARMPLPPTELEGRYGGGQHIYSTMDGMHGIQQHEAETARRQRELFYSKQAAPVQGDGGTSLRRDASGAALKTPSKQRNFYTAYGVVDMAERRIASSDLNRLAMPKGLGGAVRLLPPVRGAIDGELRALVPR